VSATTNDERRAPRVARATEARRRARGWDGRRVARDEFFSTHRRGEKTETNIFLRREARERGSGRDGTARRRNDRGLGWLHRRWGAPDRSRRRRVEHDERRALRRRRARERIEGGKGKTRCAVKLVYQRARSPTTIIVGEHKKLLRALGRECILIRTDRSSKKREGRRIRSRSDETRRRTSSMLFSHHNARRRGRRRRPNPPAPSVRAATFFTRR
jgi:hypothetical protein